jgi:hypothetical protein
MSLRLVSLLIASLAISACSGGLFNRTGATPAQQKSIGVNSLLWRASLDTLAFMPLQSADPFGGVIITGWHIDPEAPTERFRATIRILDTRLRADAIAVSLFREENTTGAWVSAVVRPETETQLENQILSRARELRLSSNPTG